MIKVEIKTNKEFDDMIKNLKEFDDYVEKRIDGAILNFYKNTTAEYEDSVISLVYDKYVPAKYDRTGHLRGEHGAIVEDYSAHKWGGQYEFYIDGDSRDPVDGTTWKEKADNVEHGSSQMYFRKDMEPFDRPFIEETQEVLNRYANDVAENFIEQVERKLSKI